MANRNKNRGKQSFYRIAGMKARCDERSGVERDARGFDEKKHAFVLIPYRLA